LNCVDRVGLLEFRPVEVWLLYCVFGTPFRASMEGFMLDSFCSGLLCSRAYLAGVIFGVFRRSYVLLPSSMFLVRPSGLCKCDFVFS